MTDVIRFCCQGGCTGLAKNGRFCEKHKTNNDQANADRARNKQETNKWYSKRVWRDRLRPMKLRLNPICEIDGCNRVATDVHHIRDEWKRTKDWELFTTMENLKSLCHEHHSAITLKENRR